MKFNIRFTRLNSSVKNWSVFGPFNDNIRFWRSLNTYYVARVGHTIRIETAAVAGFHRRVSRRGESIFFCLTLSFFFCKCFINFTHTYKHTNDIQCAFGPDVIGATTYSFERKRVPDKRSRIPHLNTCVCVYTSPKQQWS